MKGKTLIVIPVMIIFLLFGCQILRKDASIDASGFWYGKFLGESAGDTGKVLLLVYQEGSKITGKVALYNDLPSLLNFGNDIEGSVSGDQISFHLVNSSENHKFKGTIQNNFLVDGEIKNNGAKATWTADRYPTSELTIASKISCPGQIPKILTSDGSYLWVFDDYDDSLIQTNLAGHVMHQFKLGTGRGCDGLAMDGGNILLNTGQKKIEWLSQVDGSTLRTLPLDLMLGPVTCDSDYIFALGYIDGMLYTLDRSGIALPHREIIRFNSAMTCDGNFLWILQSFMPVILKYGKEGTLQNVYQISKMKESKNWITGGLAFNGQYFWIIVEEFDQNYNYTGIIKLYKLARQ